MIVPISYDILRVIWWALLGALLIGFAIMDGFDLGVGMLLPFVGRNDRERRVAINTVGPVWEGTRSGCCSAAARYSPPGRRSTRRRFQGSISPFSSCWRL